MFLQFYDNEHQRAPRQRPCNRRVPRQIVKSGHRSIWTESCESAPRTSVDVAGSRVDVMAHTRGTSLHSVA
jgi:hypothetical protein